MLWTARSRLVRMLIVVALALGLAACSDDGDSDSAAPSDQSDSSSAGPVDGDSMSEDTNGLVVPLDYLQGEWCNSDGEAWVIDGQTARFGETHDELFGELPVAAALAAGSERSLVSQTNDEFVLDLQTREVTFTRGRC